MKEPWENKKERMQTKPDTWIWDVADTSLTLSLLSLGSATLPTFGCASSSRGPANIINSVSFPFLDCKLPEGRTISFLSICLVPRTSLACCWIQGEMCVYNLHTDISIRMPQKHLKLNVTWLDSFIRILLNLVLPFLYWLVESRHTIRELIFSSLHNTWLLSSHRLTASSLEVLISWVRSFLLPFWLLFLCQSNSTGPVPSVLTHPQGIMASSSIKVSTALWSLQLWIHSPLRPLHLASISHQTYPKRSLPSPSPAQWIELTVPVRGLACIVHTSIFFTTHIQPIHKSRFCFQKFLLPHCLNLICLDSFLNSIGSLLICLSIISLPYTIYSLH